MSSIKKIEDKHRECLLAIKESNIVVLKQYFDLYKKIFDSITDICEENFQLIIEDITDTKSFLNKGKSRTEISQATSEYIAKSERFFKVLNAVKKNCSEDAESVSKFVENGSGYCREISSQSSEKTKLDIFFDLLNNINPTSSNHNHFHVYNRAASEFNSKHSSLLYQQQYLDKSYLPEFYCPLLPYLIDEIKTIKEQVGLSNKEKIQECNNLKDNHLNNTYHEIVRDIDLLGEL